MHTSHALAPILPCACRGDNISSKQLRDDLMTMLVAGHETTAAVLTWTTHLLSLHPEILAKLRAEVGVAVGGGWGRGRGGGQVGAGACMGAVSADAERQDHRSMVG